MQIVIHACGIPFNGETILTKSLGGSESAAYYVAKEFAKKNHDVIVFTDTDEPGEWDGVTYVSAGEHTQEAPLGTDYHFYVGNTPHEVSIVQRHPYAFLQPSQAKISLFWAHDIALKRNDGPMMNTLLQADAIMSVSHWFKKQICDAWTINPDIVIPIHNGVDYSLFKEFELKDNTSTENEPLILLYSSRPERGLDHLVGSGGIMEQLQERGCNAQLKVCGYEHGVPRLEGFYGELRNRIDLLPNCEHIGSLTKRDLYKFMCQEADMWVYPTEFEEVSCITAMECMAAGLPIVTTDTAALSETLGKYPNATVFPYVDSNKFSDYIHNYKNKFRRTPEFKYSWENTADEIETIIYDCFEKRKSIDSVSRHYLRNSDIVALEKLDKSFVNTEVTLQLDLYKWRDDIETYGKHYADGTEEMYDGSNFKYEENFEQHPRFQAVQSFISPLKDDGLRIIDYGCAHGHFTNNLAKLFPQHEFIGIDVSPKAIQVATDKANEWGLTNVEYMVSDWLDALEKFKEACDVLILGEILEHVPDPVSFMSIVYDVVGYDTLVVVTTPFGPWEFNSYQSEYPKRFHLHHFERSDIKEMFGQNPGFKLRCMPAGPNLFGEMLGWYVYTFVLMDGVDHCRAIDYDRKYTETVPKQTVSLCVIAKDAEYELPRLIKSVEPLIDEVIIGIDRNTTDGTRGSVDKIIGDINRIQHRCPELRYKCVDIDPAVETGFSEARNKTIELATCNWILWCDCDEEFISGERLWKYLRNNQWRGYGIPQHHFSTEPLGVLSTDYPVRLFRNHEDVRFFGIVHEHPERADSLNEGVGFAIQINDVHFSHYGYKTESVRRLRFERNIALMARDRKENPNRLLGKFLWIRDLALMCRFELEQTRGYITPQMKQHAEMGLELWEDTLDLYGGHPQVIRMVKDHLEFYDTLVNVIDQWFTFKLKLASGNGAGAPELSQMPELSARFLNRRHLDKFLSVIIDGEVKSYEGKYNV